MGMFGFYFITILVLFKNCYPFFNLVFFVFFIYFRDRKIRTCLVPCFLKTIIDNSFLNTHKTLFLCYLKIVLFF